uniref:SGS domain-containing protein n=1 Tax=Panagrolaimus sp. JU765 TaxID=591449 RepID=A0AC34R8U1_9BILA
MASLVLAHSEIVPEKTIHVIKPKKIEITLKKQESSPNHWSTLEDRNSENKKEIKYSDKWEKLIKENEKDLEEEDIYNLLYKPADDDARRAMMKSMYESGGRVLNMNWNEVKKGKVEYKEKDDE